MDQNLTEQLAAVTKFRDLHHSGCFVLPNPWDVGTAMYLHQLGFAALATTSAGFAFSQGLPDSVNALSRSSMLNHVREIVQATSLPVNADFQNGYADDPEDVAESVSLCISTGVAGLSIEDATGHSEKPLYEASLARERISAARAAIDASGIPVVLTGRCEAWLVGEPEPFKVALERLVSYADAGADCLYAPGVSSPQEIAAIVDAVAPKPVNLLVSSGNLQLTVSQLEELGVRRISVGTCLARVAWGAFMRAAQNIKQHGTFGDFADGASFADIENIFKGRSQ